MKIRELLDFCRQTRLFNIRPSASSHEIALELKDRNIGALMVTNDDREMLGIVSERDLARAFANNAETLIEKTASDLMTREIVRCSVDDDVVDTMVRLNALNIRHIPVVENGRALAMLSIRDFEHACSELQHQAKTDALTGLANKGSFEEALQSEFDLHRRFDAPMSVAMLDIDHFKSVNDTHGHIVGDQVLEAVAASLMKEVRSFDVVARVGGEEFAILFPHTDLDEAAQASERVLEMIRSIGFITKNGVVPITTSGGLTTMKRGDAAGHDVVCRADNLLYEAKSNGRNRLVADQREIPSSDFTSAWPASIKVTASNDDALVARKQI